MKLTLALLLVPLVIGSLERLAAPKSELDDPIWTRHGATPSVDHAAWARFLATYAAEDAAGVMRVAYARVTAADLAALDRYIASLEAIDPRTLSRDAALAYWLNLYNAATVRLVLEHYPVESIRDISLGLFTGPWEGPVVTVIGRELSLDTIEHGIIRPVFQEPRIHYAVNCAAVSCPDLAAAPFTAAGLDAQLDAAERDFVNDPRGVRLDGGELVLSKIWLWFRDDFGDSEAAILARLRPIATGRAAAALDGRKSVDSYDYDWALNDRP